MTKVQTTGFLLLLLAFLPGCDRPVAGFDEDVSFGDPYEIVTDGLPTQPDDAPALFSDTLVVHLSYAGGCTDHAFSLRSAVRGDSARVWIHHDARDDSCEALLLDRFEARVPEPVLQARTIELLNPSSDVPFVLRWDFRMREP